MKPDNDDAVEIVELVPCVITETATRRVGEMPFRRDAWTPQETEQLKVMFAQDRSISEIAAIIGRGYAGIADRINMLGLRRHSTRSWSDLEDTILQRDYGRVATATIAAAIGRSCTATYARAALLGLSDPNPPAWTPWEDAQLAEGYRQGLPVASIAALIGRPLSGTASRASTLKLRHPAQPATWTPEETSRALALVSTGMRYGAAIDQLQREGFPRRSKAAFHPKIRALGYGRGWGRKWTAEEDALLIQCYQSGTSLTPLRTRLGRTNHSIRWRAGHLQLQGTHDNRNGFRGGPDWTADDIATLRAEYGKTPSADLARKLGRTKPAMFTRANMLGLVHGYIKPWSEKDLKALYGAYANGTSIADLALMLDRKPMSVSKYATQHGLRFGRRRRLKPQRATPANDQETP